MSDIPPTQSENQSNAAPNTPSEVQEQATPQPEPAVETPPGPVKAAELSPEVPPKAKKGLFARLYDKETRLGRGMRAFTRGLGAVVGLFALGFMLAYALLVLPLQQRYRGLQAELAQANAALETLQLDLREAQSNLAGAETARKFASDELAAVQARLSAQAARVKAGEVRLALAQGDSAAAELAVSELETLLAALKPALHADRAATLDQVMALVKSDLTRGGNLADQDLQRLLSELELLAEEK